MSCALHRSICRVGTALVITFAELILITPQLLGQYAQSSRHYVTPYQVRNKPMMQTAGQGFTLDALQAQTRHSEGGSNSASSSTVAVSQLLIPAKATKSYERALKCFHKQEFGRALKYVEAALQDYPSFASAHALRGALEIASGQYGEGGQDLRTALAIDPGDSFAYIALAADYNLTGQFDEALNIIRQGRPFTAQLWQSHFEAGRALLGRHSFDLALDEANQASALGGRDVPALHLLKAKAYMQLGQSDHAIRELQQYVARERKGPAADKVRQILANLKRYD